MLLFGEVSGNLPDCENNQPESNEDNSQIRSGMAFYATSCNTLLSEWDDSG